MRRSSSFSSSWPHWPECRCEAPCRFKGSTGGAWSEALRWQPASVAAWASSSTTVAPGMPHPQSRRPCRACSAPPATGTIGTGSTRWRRGRRRWRLSFRVLDWFFGWTPRRQLGGGNLVLKATVKTNATPSLGADLANRRRCSRLIAHVAWTLPACNATKECKLQAILYLNTPWQSPPRLGKLFYSDFAVLA